MDRLWIVQMFLCSAAHLVMSFAVQCQLRLQSKRIECHGMQLIDIIFNIRNRDTADSADSIRKIFINDASINTDSFKDF